jgi:cyclopropane fatty-acyl-phospholipid synthase-like methyltransferase
VKRHAPATLRNRGPILAVLERTLPLGSGVANAELGAGTVLEVASGSGEHAVYFAAHLPHLTWQPSDDDDGALASIEAHRAEAGLANLAPAVRLDARAQSWPIARADAVVSINMIHIAPWEACEGLMRGAARVLSPGGVLYLYGPFKRGGAHTAPSNAAFDASLREHDAAWGVRDVDDVTREADNCGFERIEIVEMPANNLSVVFRLR